MKEVVFMKEKKKDKKKKDQHSLVDEYVEK